MTTKNAQLSLIEPPRSWRLDQHTREVGREGVARARAALRAGRHVRTPDSPAPTTRAGEGGRPVSGRRAAAGARRAAA